WEIESPGYSTKEAPTVPRDGGADPTGSGCGSATKPHSGMMKRLIDLLLNSASHTGQLGSAFSSESAVWNAPQSLQTRYSCRTKAFPGFLATARDVHSFP